MKEVVEYWITTAEHDKDTMDVLYTTKRYSDALFFGHIILEKILKALVVKETGKHAPYIHDLLQLHKLSGVVLSEAEITLLDEVDDFNIRARYPEHKHEFYKKATEEFSGRYITAINNLYQKLCQKTKL